MLPTIIQLSLRTVCPSWHLEKPSCRAGPTAANSPMGPRPTSPRAPSPASTSHVWSSAETRGWLGSRISLLLLPSAAGRLPQEWTSAPGLTVLDKSWLQPSPHIAGTPSWVPPASSNDSAQGLWSVPLKRCHLKASGGVKVDSSSEKRLGISELHLVTETYRTAL